MKFKQIVAISLVLCAVCMIIPSSTTLAQATEQNAVPPRQSAPIISFSPKSLTLTTDTSQFVTGEVKILNKGGSELRITKITPSCGCASASVQKGIVAPMDVGLIRCSVNTKNFQDTLSRVEYLIESNATATPLLYTVHVRKNYPNPKPESTKPNNK